MFLFPHIQFVNEIKFFGYWYVSKNPFFFATFCYSLWFPTDLILFRYTVYIRCILFLSIHSTAHSPMKVWPLTTFSVSSHRQAQTFEAKYFTKIFSFYYITEFFKMKSTAARFQIISAVAEIIDILTVITLNSLSFLP